MKLSNEMKVGLVVVVALAIGFMFFGKTAAFHQRKYKLKTFFKYAGNIRPDAIVKLSGVEVGRVSNISFVYDPQTRVECILELNAGAKVRSDSIAYVDTAGFVGDAYVGLSAGTSEEFFKPGSTILSEDPIQMRLIMKKADNIATNLDQILIDIKSLIGDNRQNLDSIIGNLEATTENFKEFSADIKEHPWKLLFKGE